MNKPNEAEWLAAIARVTERLDQAEIRHRMVMDELKNEIALLRTRVPEPNEESVTQAEQDHDQEEIPIPEVHREETVVPPPLPVDFQREVPKEIAVPTPADEPSFEQKLGQVWLVRIGIVLLLTGLVLGANWAYKNWIHDLSAGVRLAGLYLCAVLLGGCGILISRREPLRRYGEVLLAGGLAFFYYCTYAAHHVPRLRVIESPVAAAACLLAAAAVIAAVSWFRKSQGTAVMGILLASYAIMIQPLDWLSAASNLILAVMGVLLMLRPGWKAPGVASLAGTYGAFAGWQVLGAAGSGRGDSQATLWFLAASWAIFSVPGMLGRFMESLGARGRAIFTAANNGIFFALFSGIWIHHHGTQDMWKVAAIFGGVLLGMGMVGRKRDDGAAASNLTQGLAVLSLALLLRLDGYHLGLALAGESLALAIAFHRFRKRPEFAFALLAGIGAGVMAILPQPLQALPVPSWSSALGALLVGAAAILLRVNVDRAEVPAPPQVRSGASLLCYTALAILLVGWCWQLDADFRLPVAATLAAGFALVANLVDRRKWLVEIAYASGITGMFTVGLLFTNGSTWQGDAIAMLACLVATWAWHLPQTEHDGLSETKSISYPAAFAWLFAVLTPLLYHILLDYWYSPAYRLVLPLALGAVVWVGISRILNAHRLEITASFLNTAALALVLIDFFESGSNIPQILSFLPAACAVAVLRLNHVGREAVPPVQGLIGGVCLFVAWPAALLNAYPQFSIDLLALSALVGFAIAATRKQVAAIYCWGWSLLSLFCFGALLWRGDSSLFHGYRFEGIVLVVLFAYIALKRPLLPPQFHPGKMDGLLSWVACGVLSVWATNLTVEVFGWRGVSVLWTVLGFGLVSFGLLVRRVTSRKAGFLLLTFALAKLFLVDVWDFTTFMRVVSFVALGLALVVLGLFYHRFAPALKKLMDEEERPEPAPDPDL